MKAVELKKFIAEKYIGKTFISIWSDLTKDIIELMPMTTGKLLLLRDHQTYYIVDLNTCRTVQRLGWIKCKLNQRSIYGAIITDIKEVRLAVDDDSEKTIQALVNKANSEKAEDERYKQVAEETMKYLASKGYKRDEAEKIGEEISRSAMLRRDIFGKDTKDHFIII